MESFKAEQTVGKIEDLIYTVKDEGLREKLNSELDEFEKRCEDLKNQLHENQSKIWQLILTRDAIVTTIFGYRT
ncbi:hypothetical protein C7B76_00660 [filamentous cyanobacterium CCP2]|nr:hypothetical protein C7B76_00660 [filamentous cyanobacterium CCP2]